MSLELALSDRFTKNSLWFSHRKFSRFPPGRVLKSLVIVENIRTQYASDPALSESFQIEDHVKCCESITFSDRLQADSKIYSVAPKVGFLCYCDWDLNRLLFSESQDRN